jgi:hypothetical protein
MLKKLREDFLSNRCFDSGEDLVQAYCDAGNQFIDTPEMTRSLCTRTWVNL